MIKYVTIFNCVPMTYKYDAVFNLSPPQKQQKFYLMRFIFLVDMFRSKWDLHQDTISEKNASLD